VATGAGKDRLQGRRADLSGADAPQYLQQFTRTANIPSFSAQTPVLSRRQSVRSCCQTFYCRSPRLSCRRCSHNMERFTVGRYLYSPSPFIFNQIGNALISLLVCGTIILFLPCICCMVLVADVCCLLRPR